MRYALALYAIPLVVASALNAGQTPPPGDASTPLTKALASDPRLAPLTPDIRAKVLAEADQANGYCAEQTFGNFYACECVARKIFDHRFKVGTAIETRGSATRPATGAFTVPLTAIIADKDLNARPCLNLDRLGAWVRARLPDPKMPEARRACIVEGVAAGFQSAPFPGIVQPDSFMSSAIQACGSRE